MQHWLFFCSVCYIILPLVISISIFRKRRLDELCLERFQQYSRTFIQSWILQGTWRVLSCPFVLYRGWSELFSDFLIWKFNSNRLDCNISTCLKLAAIVIDQIYKFVLTVELPDVNKMWLGLFLSRYMAFCLLLRPLKDVTRYCHLNVHSNSRTVYMLICAVSGLHSYELTSMFLMYIKLSSSSVD